ncbi:Copper chaperone, partial [Pseudomonas sp. FEN]
CKSSMSRVCLALTVYGPLPRRSRRWIRPPRCGSTWRRRKSLSAAVGCRRSKCSARSAKKVMRRSWRV